MDKLAGIIILVSIRETQAFLERLKYIKKAKQVRNYNSERFSKYTEPLSAFRTIHLFADNETYMKKDNCTFIMNPLKIHQQIYDNEQGVNRNQLLYKATNGNTQVSYSAGAMVTVELSELMGEDKENLALSDFPLNHPYSKKPTSIDVLLEFYAFHQTKMLHLRLMACLRQNDIFNVDDVKNQ
ncbi:hypothetical protein [Saccharicrinis sp. 156]|uniref:hypothetical protein n=2 Tax=unclassified Saccharicrinis TaxID=2646859 RepID=UPI003D32FFC1